MIAARRRGVAALALVGLLIAAGLLWWRADGDERTWSTRPRKQVERDAYLRRACGIPHAWARRVQRGWEDGPLQSTDLAFVPRPPVYAGGPTNTSHSGPYGFLQNVPLVLYGPGYVPARGHVGVGREVTVADLPPTFAHLMGFDFPERRGSALREVVSRGDAPPRLLVTVVIDGGGWNVLRRWPKAWPNIARLIERGVNLDGATVGSTPSITPAIHTTLSTGAWPRDHGVTSIVERAPDGRIVGAFSEEPRTAGTRFDPKLNLRLTTLADLWDLRVDNEARVAMMGFGNYVAGMIGHGSSLRGADKDIVMLEQDGTWATETRYFSLPSYLNTEVPGPDRELAEVDRADGRIDGRWRGHAMAPLDATPAFAGWQNRTLKALIEREGFGSDGISDLIYVNYKAPDAAGHVWNMIAPEQRDTIESVDAALADLVRFLDLEVGRGRYVLALTADHGQTPYLPGDWPLDGDEVKKDVRAAFDRLDNKRGLIQSSTATTYFLDRAEMRANGITPEKIASFLSGYKLEDNAPQGLPRRYRDRARDDVYAAVIPGRRIGEVLSCTSPS